MTEQTTMFPKTELDQAHVILSHLLNEQEKAETALDNAEKKVGECNSRVYKQRQVIAWLQDKMPAAEPIAEATAEEDDIEDAEVLQIEGDVLDPITGEIVGKDALAEGLEPVAEEMLADLADEGVITEPNVSVVVVLYPGAMDDPVVTKIGEKTQYAELIADYLADSGESAEIADLVVLGENDNQGRNNHDVIARGDYGKRLIVAWLGEVEAAKDMAIARDNAKVGAA